MAQVLTHNLPITPIPRARRPGPRQPGERERGRGGPGPAGRCITAVTVEARLTSPRPIAELSPR